MKVLFAVSNEEISESIVKKYQKEYKQIISYKNVYYFNAILKELQKDKTYDRVVISEDLEAFTHTQYDQIDKFIFDKLDSISDEASNIKGNDIPIILICSDRRTKSEPILSKLFGIGIYNAIIGNDRSVDEVCRLINRPRVKKEAKSYYKIDTEEVNYQAENENDVSEMEIQNIVAHYKRLGKNEEKYVDSFDNIAAQYNDTQLRIITKFLPLNVRAVLEEKSSKYQQIMSFNNSISDNLRKSKKEEDNGPSQILLKSKNKDNIMSKPVVIPSAVNMSGMKKLARQKPVKHAETYSQANRQETTANQQLQSNMHFTNSLDINNNEPIMSSLPQQSINSEPIVEDLQDFEEVDLKEEVENGTVQQMIEPVKKGRGRPRKNPIPQTNQESTVKRGRGRPRKNPVSIQEKPESLQEDFALPELEEQKVEDTILPGFEEIDNEIYQPQQSNSQQDTVLPGFEEEPEEDMMLPGLEEEKELEYSEPVQISQPESISSNSYDNNNYSSTNNYTESADLSYLLTPNKKIVTFVGTSKNGTSFIVNNIAELMSSMGINTAILDTTQNRNAYYIYTKNEENLRQIATHSIEGLTQGVARGIPVNKNLTVYTSLPNENDFIQQTDKILETLLQNHTLILIDTDFYTPLGYFKQSQETYLVQTMDILTIQPLTAFLKELKMKNILDETKLKIVLNKMVKIRGITDATIIGGMAFYNDPAMSFMTELFNRDTIKYVSIPFDEETYIKYLQGIIECEISLKGYSKIFIQTLKELGNMIYPVINSPAMGNQGYQPPSIQMNQGGNFSSSMNNTLDKMKRNY